MKTLSLATFFIAVALAGDLFAGVNADQSRTMAEEIAAAQDYLRGKYDDFERGPGGSFSLYGLAYLAESAPLTLLDLDSTRQFLPGIHFYKTRLRTPHFEYPEVETLVAARPSATGFDFRSCLSPAYDDASPKFLALFRSVEVPKPEDRHGFVRALAELLAEITPKGRAGRVFNEGSMYRAELWYGERHWRDVYVRFSPMGLADTITVVNAKR